METFIKLEEIKKRLDELEKAYLYDNDKIKRSNNPELKKILELQTGIRRGILRSIAKLSDCKKYLK